MSITITVSKKTEQKIRRRAEVTGEDIGKIVGCLVDEVWDEHFPDQDKSPFEAFIGLGSSGRSDISEAISDHKYDEHLNPHQGFGTDPE